MESAVRSLKSLGRFLDLRVFGSDVLVSLVDVADELSLVFLFEFCRLLAWSLAFFSTKFFIWLVAFLKSLTHLVSFSCCGQLRRVKVLVRWRGDPRSLQKGPAHGCQLLRTPQPWLR